jgi:tRNA(adenine34) deaminase
MAEFKTADVSIEDLEVQIQAYTPDPAYAHDVWGKIAVAEAIQATKEGNIGVGSCVVKEGSLVIRDHNRQFMPYFRGDLHGEMVSLNRLEDLLKDDPSPNMRAYSFFSLQAPCPMCMLRLVTSGVGRIYHVYSDTGTPDQGDLSSLERLPPVWGELAKRQEIGEADCSPELKEISRQAFLLSVSVAAEKMQNR